MSSGFLYKNTNTTKTGFSLYCFSFFTFLSGLTYACTFTFFFASKNMQSEYCYRMSNNTAFQFLREELLKLLHSLFKLDKILEEWLFKLLTLN